MGVDHKGIATCRHCGAQFSLFSIFNRSMQGLANSWRKKHERGCKDKTPAQRHAWARQYIARGDESSIRINPDHPGMTLGAGGNEGAEQPYRQRAEKASQC